MSNDFVSTFSEGETPPASPLPVMDSQPMREAERAERSDFAKEWDDMEQDAS